MESLFVRKCPKCGSSRIHRSRSRGVIERLRKAFSPARPHRCHACGWRGWGVETQEPAEPEKVVRRREVPDLEAIDLAVAAVSERDAEAAPPRKKKVAGRSRKAR